MKSTLKTTALLACLLTGMNILAGWESERIERDLETQAGESLRVKNINGSIDIVGWDNGHIQVLAVKEAKSGNGYSAKEKLNLMDVSIERSSNGWEIVTQIDRKKWSRRMNNTRINYELRVPHELLLDIETTNGEVDVDTYDGDIRLESTNGNLIAKSIRGKFEGDTTNGSIRLELLEYDGGDLKCRTTNGNVTLSLPGNIQADVSARTTNGSVKTDIPMKISGTMSRTRINGTMNGGGNRIDLRTTNGSIRINEL